jgi:eukaryotic-like serine/threonine-protein kinase
MGTVWLAEHLGLDAPVAVKLIDPKASGGAEALRLCQKEASAAAALRSPHVVQVLDFGMDDETGSPFIVMELLEGDSLADRLQRLGKLSPGDTSRVLTHVGRALSRAHEVSIIHRDLKPANVFLVRNEDEELAKVLDFGTARVQRAAGLTGATTPTGAVIGTPFYMSPEHITGQPIDHRTDLWAMAVMAFECLTGRRPFDANDIGQLVLQICTYPIAVPSHIARVPAGFDDWFARATQREVGQRFRSAREMVDDLRRICGRAAGSFDGDAEPVTPRTLEMGPPSMPVPVEPTRRRRVWWVAASAVVVGAVVTVAALGGFAHRAATPPPAANAGPTTLEAAPPATLPGPAAAAGSSAGLPLAPAPTPRAQAERRLVRRKPPPPPTPTPARASGPATAEPARAQPSPALESVLDHRR